MFSAPPLHLDRAGEGHVVLQVLAPGNRVRIAPRGVLDARHVVPDLLAARSAPALRRRNEGVEGQALDGPVDPVVRRLYRVAPRHDLTSAPCDVSRSAPSPRRAVPLVSTRRAAARFPGRRDRVGRVRRFALLPVFDSGHTANKTHFFRASQRLQGSDRVDRIRRGGQPPSCRAPPRLGLLLGRFFSLWPSKRE